MEPDERGRNMMSVVEARQERRRVCKNGKDVAWSNLCSQVKAWHVCFHFIPNLVWSDSEQANA